MSVTAAVSTITGAIDAVKKLAELSSTIKNAEARSLIAELHNQLADIKTEMAQVKEENVRLRRKLSEYEDQRANDDNLEQRGSLYYFKTPVSGRSAGPYCPNCWQATRKLIGLQKLKPPFDKTATWDCPGCEQLFSDDPDNAAEN